MSLFDEDVPKKSTAGEITVGEDLSRLSEGELSKRISALRAEINRHEKELEQRDIIRNDADALFSK